MFLEYLPMCYFIKCRWNSPIHQMPHWDRYVTFPFEIWRCVQWHNCTNGRQHAWEEIVCYFTYVKCHTISEKGSSLSSLQCLSVLKQIRMFLQNTIYTGRTFGRHLPKVIYTLPVNLWNVTRRFANYLMIWILVYGRYVTFCRKV